jgi:NADH-quinone oxidoreductase subunit B
MASGDGGVQRRVLPRLVYVVARRVDGVLRRSSVVSRSCLRGALGTTIRARRGRLRNVCGGLIRNIQDTTADQHNAITGKLEDLVNWARARSSWPATFGLACCAIEMMATGGAHYDISRFGMEVFRASPRQADIMIVAGRVSQKMAPVLRQVYDQMMEPKWVISMGVCASSGGMFQLHDRGVDQVVPVDVYAPGCPPTPETLIHAIETLHQLIEDGHLMKRRAETGAGANVHVQEIPSGAESIPVLLGTR